jgi:hypothetical protein
MDNGLFGSDIPDADYRTTAQKLVDALRNVQINGAYQTGQNQYANDVGYGGRLGYGAQVGDDGYLSGGVSGSGYNVKTAQGDRFANSNITGGDLSYSTPDWAVSARYDKKGMAGGPNMQPYSAADMGGPMMPQQMEWGPMPVNDRFSVNFRKNF